MAKTESVRKQCERPRKLSFKEQRELEALLQRIEVLEREQQQLYQTMGDPCSFKRGKMRLRMSRPRYHPLNVNWPKPINDGRL